MFKEYTDRIDLHLEGTFDMLDRELDGSLGEGDVRTPNCDEQLTAISQVMILQDIADSLRAIAKKI